MKSRILDYAIIAALTTLISVSLVTLSAQEVLTTKDAIALAIDNNYNIQLSQNNIKVAENNSRKENNGYLPTVNVNVGPTGSFGGSTQQFGNGMTAEVREAFSWTAGAGVNANYTLYDKSRDLKLDQMKERLNLTNLQLRQSIENTIYQVYNQYYAIAQLSENTKALEEALKLSLKRKERLELRYELGQGLKLDILNAQVDISRDSVNYLSVIQQLDNAKRDLEVIMGIALTDDYAIDTDVTYELDMLRDGYLERASSDNVSLLLSDQNQQINQLDLDIIATSNKPTIGSNAGLSYNYQANAPGSFITSSTNSGLNVGVTLNWNILDGGRRKVLEQNALINMETETLTRAQIVKEITRDINNAWGSYQNALYILEVEQNSLEINQLNLSRTDELYKAGQATSIEFRQAQLNLLQSEIGYNQARYDAKLIELQLRYLSGDIMRDVE